VLTYATYRSLSISKLFCKDGGGGLRGDLRCEFIMDLLGTEKGRNGNASETKANESSDNGVFFDIEALRTASIVNKLFSKRSKHISWNNKYFRSKANTFDCQTTVFKAKTNMSDSKKIIFKAKQTH
jgi:hypothetical protein